MVDGSHAIVQIAEALAHPRGQAMLKDAPSTKVAFSQSFQDNR
jgi:hypothetical protein